MQKVSKQKLAILLLTVLLAISIGLTISFASLRTSEEVTGSITFTGGLSIAISEGTNGNGITFTAQGNGLNIAFAEEAFTYDGEQAVLSEEAKTTLATAKVLIQSSADKVFYYKVEITQPTTLEAQVTMSGIGQTSTAVDLQSGNAGSVNNPLTTYIQDIVITAPITEVAEFTITFIADYIDID